MAVPTPRFTPAVGPTPPRADAGRPASRTPLRLEPVTPAAPRKPKRPRWTLMLVPPPRVPAPVRTVELKRRYAVPPMAALFVALGIVAYSAAQYGAWTHEAMIEPTIAQLHERFDEAEARLRVLTDSVSIVGQQVAAVAAVREAAAARAASLGASPGVVLPVDGRITSRFAPKRVHPILRIYRPHRGLDIAAPAGTPIRTPAAGRVIRAGRDLGYGLVVEVDHGGGVITRYAHCKSILVEKGQLVDAGTPIATVGNTGLSTAPHLHYEVRVQGEPRDPMRTPVEYTR